MATSCAYKPGVKNKQGEIVNSRLFDSLLSLFNKDRSEAKKHYFIATHSDFLEESLNKIFEGVSKEERLYDTFVVGKVLVIKVRKKEVEKKKSIIGKVLAKIKKEN